MTLPLPPSSAQPISASERLPWLDAVRGLALFGILWINVYNTVGLHPWNAPNPSARGVVLVEQFLAYGKFISLFSLLFGVGFALQLGRLERTRPRIAAWVYTRRLLALLLFGVLHYLLVWDGDVLHIYAAIGVLMLLAHRLRPARSSADYAPLFWLGGAIILIYGFSSAEMNYPDFERARSLLDFVAVRAGHATFLLQSVLFYLVLMLGIFRYGETLISSGRLTRPLEHLGFWRRTLAWSLPLGLGISALHVLALARGDSTGYVLHILIGFPLGLAYLCAVVLLYARGVRLRPLEAAGRMALSNYLAQSLCFTFVLYPYGLNLSGRFTPSVALAYVLGFFALQCLASHLWLRRFRMGPLEWLWRTLTYGRAQAMRLEPEDKRARG